LNAVNSWQHLSVEAFFTACNWQGQAVELRPNGHEAAPSRSLEMTVGDFFRALPWEGTPEVGSLPKPPVMEVIAGGSSENKVTIDELSDLF